MLCIGLDIGTTTISAVVIDVVSGSLLESVTKPNSATIKTSHLYERLQDPNKIIATATSILDDLLENFPEVAGIGLTGQMHGILYTDKNGQAVSPLYTWQDARGDEKTTAHISYAEELSRLTAQNTLSPIASGYGSVTHFYNTQNKLVPENATSFSTIQAYVGLRLTERNYPLLHSSDAASLGLYNYAEASFSKEAVTDAKMDFSYYPEVTEDFAVLGSYKGRPVSVGIGDNQASFIGSVQNMESSILVNVGTGQQISALSSSYKANSPIEARPCVKGQFLQVGAPICGGEVYALLENFFSQAVLMATGEKAGKLYEKMNTAALKLLDNPPSTEKLTVSTLFRGTRQDSTIRGSITGISPANFTPEALTVALLEGIAHELWQMYCKMELTTKKTVLIGAGNGIRLNPPLQKILEKQFNMPLKISKHKEEAAFGAAMFCYAALCISSSGDSQSPLENS